MTLSRRGKKNLTKSSWWRQTYSGWSEYSSPFLRPRAPYVKIPLWYVTHGQSDVRQTYSKYGYFPTMRRYQINIDTRTKVMYNKYLHDADDSDRCSVVYWKY